MFDSPIILFCNGKQFNVSELSLSVERRITGIEEKRTLFIEIAKISKMDFYKSLTDLNLKNLQLVNQSWIFQKKDGIKNYFYSPNSCFEIWSSSMIFYKTFEPNDHVYIEIKLQKEKPL